MVQWIAGLAVLAMVDLVATVHAMATWHKQPGTAAVLTLNQMLGLITSIGLLIIVTLIVITGLRRRRDARRHLKWLNRRPTDLDL
jgi:hypothetical protein